MYTIDDDKFEEVMDLVERFDPKVLPETIRDHLVANWHEGGKHQEWLNGSSAGEIVDWIIVTAYQG